MRKPHFFDAFDEGTLDGHLQSIEPPCIKNYARKQKREQTKRRLEDLGFNFFVLFVCIAIIWFFIYGGVTGGKQ